MFLNCLKVGLLPFFYYISKVIRISSCYYFKIERGWLSMKFLTAIRGQYFFFLMNLFINFYTRPSLSSARNGGLVWSRRFYTDFIQLKEKKKRGVVSLKRRRKKNTFVHSRQENFLSFWHPFYITTKVLPCFQLNPSLEFKISSTPEIGIRFWTVFLCVRFHTFRINDVPL